MSMSAIKRFLPSYNFSPEQLNLWYYLAEKFTITKITPVFYIGPTAGTPFLTYAATKLYYNLGSYFSDVGGGSANVAQVNFYNELNVQSLRATNLSTTFRTDTIALSYTPILLEIYNIYFSRFTVNVYSSMSFNGFELTIA